MVMALCSLAMDGVTGLTGGAVGGRAAATA
jgi:hypothetical protein